MGETDRSSGPNGRRWTAIAVTGLLAAIVIVGLVVSRDNSPGGQQLAVTTAAEPGTSTPAGTADAPPATGAQGKGQPIVVVGTSPIDGSRVNLASFRGTPVVLQIWASWCPGCNDEAPHVAALSKRTDVAFVGLNFRDSDSDAKEFYRKYGWTFPSIEDPAGEKAFGLGLQGTPTTIFLDAQLREVGRFVGAVDRASLTEAVDTLTGTA